MGLRRWRLLIAVVALWVVVFFYFTADESQFYATTPANSGLDTGIKWSKLPDHYPATSLRALPTDKAPVYIPNIQRHPPPTESKAAKTTRESRLAAVKESFRHSWGGYKKYAWLNDEVTPLSGKRKDPFGGWAATLVDALDTLWIMGMKDDFRQAVKACEQIDFSYTGAGSINVFETTIRYLGGFLAAYELSEMEYPSLLKKAVEVAELLLCAFDTPNRMPITRWSWQE